MRRIVPAVLMLTALVALPAQAQQHGHTIAMPELLKWVEPAVLPGARLAVVQGDPSKEGIFTVLAGAFFVGAGEKFDQRAGQELPVGGFVSIPPDHPHFAWAGTQETVVQVHGVGPTDLRFLNPEDDPRKKK